MLYDGMYDIGMAIRDTCDEVAFFSFAQDTLYDLTMMQLQCL